MALAHNTSVRLSEVQLLQEHLSTIKEVEQAFAKSSRESLSVLIVLPEHNSAVERRLAEIEGQLIDSFPWLEVDFDIVLRSDRDITELVSPKGFQLLAR
jgi:hypothetical protein